MREHVERTYRPEPEKAAPRPRKLVIQRKLTVGAVDDPHEREADSVAAAVVQRLSTPVDEADAPAGRIRRSATAAASGAAFEPAPEVESRIQRAMSGGAPLEADLRGQFEGALGADLGNVRVHRDAEAGALSRELSAQAFTAGNHVFFGEGTYAPGSSSGQHLIAHELAHTVQQGGSVQRQVIRRFSLDNTDFTKTTGVTVFGKGGSGRVAQFDDGGAPLIVKVDQLIGNEVVVAGNLHQAVAQQTGGSGGSSVKAPRSRLATAQEKAQIKATTLATIDPTIDPRNFTKGLDSTAPTVLMEKSSGKDFSDVLKEGGHTKKGMFGKPKANSDSIVFKMTSQPGPLTTLGQHLAADVVMGMFDRLVGYYNPDNFMFDEATGSFGFVDNTQNADWGFITDIDYGGGVQKAAASFKTWAANAKVQQLATDPGKLAQEMWDKTIEGGIAGDLTGEAKGLFVAAIAKNKQKMLQWIVSGITAGRTAAVSALGNPLALIDGIEPDKRADALQSLLAKGYLLRGLPADKAWAAAGVQAQRLLNPKPIPQQQPTPSSATASAQPPSGGPGEGSSGGGQQWVPGRRWKTAQPSNA